MSNTQNTQNCVEVADIEVEVFDENEDISLDYIDPQDIDPKFFNKEVYFNLIKSLLKKSPFLLRRINIELLPNKNRDYFQLCKMVVENNKYDTIRYVQGNHLSKTEYYQLCLTAIHDSVGNICHIDAKHLTAEHYLECCRVIAKKRCYLEVIEREFLPKKYQGISLLDSDSYDILLKS